MSGRLHKLKVALALVTVAYAAYLHLEEEKEKKRSRNIKETIKRKYELTRSLTHPDSSSSDEYEPSQKKSFQSTQIKIEQDSNDEFAGTQDNINSNTFTIRPDFVNSFVSKFSESQFKDAFRISRNTANQLFVRFKSSPEYKNIFKLTDQTRIPAKHYIWMFLWFVGRKCSYLELSEMFNVPLYKSVCVVDTVLQFLNSYARDFIRFPETPSELRASAESFQQIAGFPDVIACLVSTKIKAKADKDSFVAQVFCDSKGRFLDVFVDSTIDIHSTEVLEKSQMNQKLKNICQGKYHTLATNDYFVREWLLTPIDRPSSGEHIRYNRKHAKTMNVVSDSLELLTQRFPQLTNMHLLSSYKIKKVFTACCVLQNICLENEDFFDTEEDPLLVKYYEDKLVQIKEKPIDGKAHLQKIGELKRKQVLKKLID
ncbi:uncharacterized protein LOC129950189 [Eupeodes corollae]|uniref:uncharacterized protein LOC129950189 n=1 Tax=Eupeodes corollae TaxID=290404 RepID=UPI002492B757|nr:uncharacterized protein LOC129950189 [Eupeodes corollae]